MVSAIAAVGSSGSAMSTVAWVILFGGGVLFVFAVPALRDAAADRLQSSRDFFFGPPPETTEPDPADPAEPSEGGPSTSRRDADLNRLLDTFDLSIFDES